MLGSKTVGKKNFLTLYALYTIILNCHHSFWNVFIQKIRILNQKFPKSVIFDRNSSDIGQFGPFAPEYRLKFYCILALCSNSLYI